jgi:hypothetical protein
MACLAAIRLFAGLWEALQMLIFSISRSDTAPPRRLGGVQAFLGGNGFGVFQHPAIIEKRGNAVGAEGVTTYRRPSWSKRATLTSRKPCVMSVSTEGVWFDG